MLYAKVENNIVIDIFNLKDKYNNVSFPNSGPDSTWLQENNLLPVTVGLPHDRLTQKLVSCEPYVDQQSVFTVRVESLTQEEIDNNNNSLWAKIRGIRNNLLKETDWTVLPDAPFQPEQKQKWIDYRQSLRDITNQSDSNNITWPIAPDK